MNYKLRSERDVERAERYEPQYDSEREAQQMIERSRAERRITGRTIGQTVSDDRFCDWLDGQARVVVGDGRRTVYCGDGWTVETYVWTAADAGVC